MLHITNDIQIHDWELSESFVRASGPGGQNVNKVSSAVELRFEAGRSPALSDSVKRRLKRIAGRKWTLEGALIIQVQDTRSQARNREIAQERLAEMIKEALVVPKRRIPTRPSKSAQRKRVDTKTQRGQVKSLRGKIQPDD